MRKSFRQCLYLTVALTLIVSLNSGRFAVLAIGSSEGLAAAGNQMWQQDSDGIEGESESSTGTSGIGFYRAGDKFGKAVAVGDFDGDGYDDMVVGVPDEDAEGFTQIEGGGNSIGKGAINVIYGRPGGLSSSRNQLWQQGTGGIPGGAEEGDQFGAALTVGDFNGDGRDDLAIGIPGEDSTNSELGHPHSGTGKGAVAIMYGSPSGLGDNHVVLGISNQLFYQDVDGIQGIGEHDDQYGASLASGDFNHDGYADLAIGVPGEDNDDGKAGGAVAILYGSLFGLSANGDELWDQESDGISGNINDGDEFGAALAAGDFDNDGYDDLLIGIPGESGGGAVTILYGTASGLSSARSRNWSIQSGRFGAALAAGDFNNDGYEDVAVGVPDSDIPDSHGSGIRDCGSVVILEGSHSGLTNSGQIWDQNGSIGDEFNLRGGAENHDHFGAALTTGDFNNDGYDDLAVGIPDEDITEDNDGAVAVIYGSHSGLNQDGNQMWDQNGSEDPDKYNLEGGCEKDDNFGSAVASGDFDGDGIADLAIGVPGEDGDAGAVNVIYGTGNHAPTAEAGGPYQVNNCGSIVLDATRSSDRDPGDVLTYTWDLDGDGVFGETGPQALRGNEVGMHPTFIPNNLTFINARAFAEVRLRVTDQHGLEGLDNTLITVTDTPPAISCPGNITKSTSAGSCSALVELIAATATDNCEGVVVTSVRSDNQSLTAAYPKGTTTITWKATDSVGNITTCQQTVTIVDGEKPVLQSVSNITKANDPGKCSANINIVAPTASDNCGSVTVTGVRDDSQTLTAPYPKGRTTINWTATDSSGNTDSFQQTVQVNDTEKPTISCPLDINRNTDPGKCSASVSVTTPSIADNCPGATVSGARSDKQPLTADYPKGATIINWTATDASGNIATCQQTINVRDGQFPVINQPADMTVATAPGQCSAPVSFVVTASDNCPNVRVSTTPPSGSVFAKGSTVVTTVAIDEAGNSSTANFRVTVVDTEKPALTRPADLTGVAVNPGDRTAVINYPAPAVTDNCGVANVACNPPSGSVFPVGVTTVSCTATDTSGNVSSTSFRVTLFDIGLQDDSDSSLVLLINSSTGDYRACLRGSVYTGVGTVIRQGDTFVLNHTLPDRRVHASVVVGPNRGSASYQLMNVGTVITITDRDIRNNSCVCAAGAG